jgi:hypothetical protein
MTTTMYAGQAPWDIGKPQKPFIDVADRIAGSILDAGCGTGDTALFSPGGVARSRASTSSNKRSTGPAQGCGARLAGHVPGPRRPDAQGLA